MEARAAFFAGVAPRAPARFLGRASLSNPVRASRDAAGAVRSTHQRDGSAVERWAGRRDGRGRRPGRARHHGCAAAHPTTAGFRRIGSTLIAAGQLHRQHRLCGDSTGLGVFAQGGSADQHRLRPRRNVAHLEPWSDVHRCGAHGPVAPLESLVAQSQQQSRNPGLVGSATGAMDPLALRRRRGAVVALTGGDRSRPGGGGHAAGEPFARCRVVVADAPGIGAGAGGQALLVSRTAALVGVCLTTESFDDSSHHLAGCCSNSNLTVINCGVCWC